MTTPAPVRVWENHLLTYGRVWRSNVLGAFVQPVLYLLGLGLGVGALVDDGNGPQLLSGLSYLGFIAPALIATTAMMVVSQEALWPVMAGFVWTRHYRAMAATPLSPTAIVSGALLWNLTRGGIAATGFSAALTLFSDTRSWWLLVTPLFGSLTGAAFGMPITAWSASREAEQSFAAVLRFVIVPLFLFAGVFYPIDRLPGWLEIGAKLTPLWHGVELCRGTIHGRLSLASGVGHIAVLFAFIAVGWTLCRRIYARRLAE